MISSTFTRTIIRSLDWLAARTLPSDAGPAHLRTGKLGEEAAYFYLRRLGYIVVARNFRPSRCRGEIDLIAWDKDVLCFVEVKTRTTLDVKPPEAAVAPAQTARDSRARAYLRRLPPSCQWRFDIVGVYCERSKGSQPQIDVFRNASLSS